MKLTKSQQRLEDTRNEVRRLWALMCEAAGVPTDSNFVVFETNPHTVAYNDAMKAFQNARKAEANNKARRDRHAAYTSCGLQRVRGALGGVYYE